MRLRKRLIVAVCAGAILIVVFLGFRRLTGQRIVERATAPDGAEFCVPQRPSREGCTTSIYYRKPGRPWGWFSYDHQDARWGGGELKVDRQTGQIELYRGSRIVATFEWESERFRLLRSDFPHREFIGAQKWMPEGWSIPRSMFER